MTLRNWNRDPFEGTYNPITITDYPMTVSLDPDLGKYGLRLPFAPLRTASSGNMTIKRASDNFELTEVSRTTAPSTNEYRVDYEADTYLGTGWTQFNAANNGLEVLVSCKISGDLIKGGSIAQLDEDQTWTGDNTFSGDDTLSGTKAFTGDSAFSGSATFTGTTLFGNNNIAIFSDVKSSATAGGALDSSSPNIRDLNTTVVNNITGCSLASNKVTLPAGTYYVRGTAPAWRVDGHQIKLYNDSDSSDVIYGTAEYSPSAAATVSQTSSRIEGYFTIASSKDFEIRHYVATTRATNGAGVGVPSGNNVTFATIFIQKVA